VTDDRPSDVLGALPRTRPQRRSEKRPARTTASSAGAGGSAPRAKTATARSGAAGARERSSTATRERSVAAARRAKQPARRATKRRVQPRQLRGTEGGTPARRGPSGVPILSTAVQAVGELAEIGMTLSARALRGAVSRLPRP
jgi:hypothetical protein